MWRPNDVVVDFVLISKDVDRNSRKFNGFLYRI